MPRKPIDYTNTIFYKIVCKDLHVLDCYVGHTTEFKNRKSSHKGRCDNPTSDKHSYKIYNIIRDHGGWDNWEMIMIAQHVCANALEARKLEREYYESLHASLNNNIPSGTIEEWRASNKSRLFAKYDCPCGGTCAFKHKSRHEQSSKHLNWLEENKITN